MSNNKLITNEPTKGKVRMLNLPDLTPSFEQEVVEHTKLGKASSHQVCCTQLQLRVYLNYCHPCAHTIFIAMTTNLHIYVEVEV